MMERVFAYGFAYGVGEHSDSRWGDRYGEGTLAGKRAMLVVTMGGWDSHYRPRGVNGPIDDILFPIHHGVLYYPGYDVLPPFLVYRTGRIDETRYAQTRDALGERLDALAQTPPIAFRRQNGGAYEIPALTLREDVLFSRVFGLRLVPHPTPEQLIADSQHHRADEKADHAAGYHAARRANQDHGHGHRATPRPGNNGLSTLSASPATNS